MNMIRMAINSYKIIEKLNIGWYEVLDNYLSEDTKRMVDNSRMNLHVLAVLIKLTMQEIKTEQEIDQVFNRLFHDQNLVLNLLSECGND